MDPGRTPETLTGARIRWRAAEERLYPLALADSDAYMDAVEAVGRVLTELRRSCASNADLMRAETDHALLAVVGSGSRSPTPPEPAIVIAAACALRSAELGGEPT
ncbi:MAG TPA: hypothetical protein VFB74_21405 [Kribbellaceae bacterium]|nr:hypothetical protein [Kribbellaceae bacterium]